MLYASYTRGFKAGGFDTRANNVNSFEFEEEEASSFEIGAKSSLLDGDLDVNIALFLTDYDDLQFSQFDVGRQEAAVHLEDPPEHIFALLIFALRGGNSSHGVKRFGGGWSVVGNVEPVIFLMSLGEARTLLVHGLTASQDQAASQSRHTWAGYPEGMVPLGESH